MNYADYFKDPRWTEYRKRVLERDKNSCTVCGSSKQLQVHHRLYCHGNAPWDYDLEHVVTLCKDCHDAVEFVVMAVRDNPWIAKVIINRVTDEMMAKGI